MRFGNNQERAKQLSKEIEQAFDAMIDKGHLIKQQYMKPVFGPPNADGTRIAVWHDVQNSQWVLDILWPDGSTGRHTGRTRTEIIQHFLQARGELEIENQQIIRENERIEQGLPDGIYRAEDCTPAQLQWNKWLREYPHGREFSESASLLDAYAHSDMYNMLMGMMKELGLSSSSPNAAKYLDRAYCELLDNNDTFWGFRVKALEEKQRRIDANAAQQAESRREYVLEADTPYSNLPVGVDVRSTDEAKEVRAATEGMTAAELKKYGQAMKNARTAAGVPVERIPMTGTRLRPDQVSKTVKG
jgi:hypothetical protein